MGERTFRRIITRSREPIEIPPGRVHGTHSAYVFGCGCYPCLEAHRTHQRLSRAQRLADRIFVAGRWLNPRAPHGTNAGYNDWGCRCTPCSDAQRAYFAARRASLAETSVNK